MIVVTGGSGFVGTNLVSWLDKEDLEPHVIDRRVGNSHQLDLLPPSTRTVVHLAANADVRGGWNNPTLDIEQNFLLTAKLLESMRHQDIRNIVFASTGSVYQPANLWHNEYSTVEATSLYAASKIAAENLIAAYAHAGHLDSAVVLRFVSIMGPHYSHGLIKDFVKKLSDNDSKSLGVLAPGTSEKSYVSVHDVVHAIGLMLTRQPDGFNVYNVGTHEFATPLDIARWVTEELAPGADVHLEGETWTGDNPAIKLDCSKLIKLGWSPQLTIEQAIKETAAWTWSQLQPSPST